MEALIQHSLTGSWLYFRQPLQIITTRDLNKVISSLQEIEALVEKNNCYAVGLISYEAAPGFDSALKTHNINESDPPLLYFALYDQSEKFLTAQFPNLALTNQQQNCFNDNLTNWRPSLEKTIYSAALNRIHNYINQGDCYQVNYTWRLTKNFSLIDSKIVNPKIWFLELVAAHNPRHAAYLDLGQFIILSVSPELFFTLAGQQITTRPMKGTAARVGEPTTDAARAIELHQSIKNRAENVMIVDMMRNDLGRIAKRGSVKVTELFSIERYPTVWQMTSTITANTDYSLAAIFSALFPAASVTGAPKVKTMQIIADLETTNRGIYTGAVGIIAPQRQAEFNVAIRTLVINRNSGNAQYGVGGGIVWDSNIDEEYNECLAKAQVLWVKRPQFALLETLLWTPTTGFFLLTEHLERLLKSADYFGYLIDLNNVQQQLTNIAVQFSNLPQRVRLTLEKNGELNIETAPFNQPTTAALLMLAPKPINAANPFLYHKTTYRIEYEELRRNCPPEIDVLLWNEAAEITETTIANLVVELDGLLVTPPVNSGLLAGVYRRHLLENKKICEGKIKISDLNRVTAIWIINSVRGWQHATLLNNVNDHYAKDHE